MTLSASADHLEPPSCASFRRAIFRGLRQEEIHLRSATLDLISQKVEKWTKEFYLNGGLSNTPPPSAGGMLQRSDSSRLDFADVFEPGDDERQQNGADSAMRSPEASHDAPLTPAWINDAFDKHEENKDQSRLFKVSYSLGNLYKFDEGPGRDLRSSLEGFQDETLTFDEMNLNLREYYLTLLRMTVDCPFPDMRIGCRSLLDRVKNLGAELPDIPTSSPSWLMPVEKTIGFEPANAAKQHMTRELSLEHPFSASWTKGSFIMGDSDDEEELPMSPSKETSGISIPNGRNDRARSQSRTRTPAGSMPGRGGRRGGDRMTSFSPVESPMRSSVPRQRFKIKQVFTALHNQKLSGKPLPAPLDVHQFQLATFARDGRFTNLNKILSYFPDYANANSHVLEVLMNSSGTTFPRTWKFYLGIMAAAEHKCQYFVSLLTSRFLECNGNRAWLKGLRHAHPKLQRIGKLNTALAHTPWRLDMNIIRELVKGVDEDGHKCEPNADCHNWSTTEIVHAISILSYYHCQSALALGLGIVPEADTPGGYVLPPSAKSNTLLMTPLHLPTTAPNNQENNDISGSPPASLLEESSELAPGLSFTRKRPQLSSSAEKSEKTADGPDKWLKTPNGSVPTSEVVPESTSSRPGTGHRPLSHQKRRKSFEDCAASDDDAVPTMISATTSYSAPNSFVPTSDFHRRPLGIIPVSQHPFRDGREFFLSPSSSTSSLFEASQKAMHEYSPVNQLLEDCEKFLRLDDNVETVREEFDLKSQDYSFLPMEDFDWECNACEIIGEYAEGLEDVFDNYFKRVREIHDELPDEDMNGSGSLSSPHSRVGSMVSPGGDPFFPIDEPGDHGSATFFPGSSHFPSPSQTFRSVESNFPDLRQLKEAVWFYSLRLLGMQKDDYTYSDIKVYLPKGARCYLRRVCERPEVVTPKDWKNVDLNISVEDKVLMTVLATQARFMGELLYGVKAVSEYREHAH